MAQDAIWLEALDLLAATPCLGKIRRPGTPLTTSATGAALVDPATLARLRLDADPARHDLQRVIWALDLLAVGRPDQVTTAVDANAQRVAGKLRERFSRTYKMSAYAEVRATKNN